MYDLVAKVGETATENGQKVKWMRVGVMIEREGKKNIKLDAMPVGTDWDGWLVVKEREQEQDNVDNGKKQKGKKKEQSKEEDTEPF